MRTVSGNDKVYYSSTLVHDIEQYNVTPSSNIELLLVEEYDKYVLCRMAYPYITYE